MKIILFGATGDAGRAALDAATRRGHQVTAVARRPGAATPQVTPLALDLLAEPEAAARAALGHDIVVSTLRPPAGREPDLVPLTRAALDAARAAGIPALITGGAATLKLADGSGHTVLSAPGFLPDEVRPIAEACAAQDALLASETGVQWTCLRPPAMLFHGPATGDFRFGTDTLVTDETGASQISFADFGAALISLAENPQRRGQRLTVGWGTAATAPAAS
ncbi:NAD(P)-dependent oxidoreductase [Cribrihabitans neustonicus]|uniref:NAD(P)-dependent oxidoreductase n=1 Tax=Cribrihabitans neustonicus TaxID=1429085 RepID=UPI003B5C1877